MIGWEFILIKVILLLIISFFLLFAVDKIESKPLKSFGRVLAVALWFIVGVLVVFSLYYSITGKYRLKYKKYWKYPAWKHHMWK